MQGVSNKNVMVSETPNRGGFPLRPSHIPPSLQDHERSPPPKSWQRGSNEQYTATTLPQNRHNLFPRRASCQWPQLRLGAGGAGGFGASTEAPAKMYGCMYVYMCCVHLSEICNYALFPWAARLQNAWMLLCAQSLRGGSLEPTSPRLSKCPALPISRTGVTNNQQPNSERHDSISFMGCQTGRPGC